MLALENGTRITLRNILYLTDFSDSSEAALPVVRGIASTCSATVHVLHVVLPDPNINMSVEMASAAKEAEQETVKAQVQQVESQLKGLSVKGYLSWDANVWPSVERALVDHEIDLIVVGTTGRTGGSKWIWGSVAEEIIRRSPVPVMTVGPFVRGECRSDGRFHCVLFATDFSVESAAAEPYAISLAEESDAKLILLHVNREHGEGKRNIEKRLSVAEAMHLLDRIVPSDAALWCRPEALVLYGQPAARILETAKEYGADLIVMGVRGRGHLLAATRREGTTAHKIVARAMCPVLTVYGKPEQEGHGSI